MTQSNNLTAPPIYPVSLGKRMLQGAAIALILIIIFLVKAGTPNPEWGKLWMLRPLVIVPLAGAAGGVFFFLLDALRYQGGWKKVIANVLSLLVYLIGLWMGTILGLDGTMWN